MMTTMVTPQQGPASGNDSDGNDSNGDDSNGVMFLGTWPTFSFFCPLYTYTIT